jgi:hypothetical protein
MLHCTHNYDDTVTGEKMARTKTLPIRVNEEELATFEAMAHLEKLPVGTFIRRWLMFEAEQRGIVPLFVEKHNRAGEVSEAMPSAIAS